MHISATKSANLQQWHVQEFDFLGSNTLCHQLHHVVFVAGLDQNARSPGKGLATGDPER